MSEVLNVSPAYVPGVCNINRAEIAQRRKAGYVGVALTVVLLVALLAFSLNRWFRLLLFFPAFLAAVGLLQAQAKFCVGYASSGMEHAGAEETSKITDTEAHSKDKRRARQINLQSALLAIAVVLVTLLVR